MSPAPGYVPSIVATGSANTGTNQNQTLLGVPKANMHTFAGGGTFFGGGNNGTYFCDCYIADTLSGTVVDYTGNLYLSALFPNADVTTMWTPLSGSTLYTQVNANPPVGDSAYIYDDTPDDLANFNWQPTTNNVIFFVHYGVYTRKDNEGTRTFQLTVGPSFAFEQLGPIISPGDAYLYYFFAMDADPNTGLAWTQSGFNATQFGIQILT